MSVTSYVTGSGLSDPLGKILWSSKLHKETLNELYFEQRGLTKTEDGDEPTFDRRSSAPIIVKNDFTKDRGQRIRLALRKQLTVNSDHTASLASYTYGNTTMIDQEETMDLYDMEVVVELLKHAVGFASPEIQNLRTNYRMDAQAAEALRDWMRNQKEESIIDAFIDGHAAHVIAEGLKSTVAHPNIYRAGGVSGNDDLSASDNLNVAELRRMYAWARSNKINPLNAMGKDAYVLLAPVFATNDLDADSTYRTSMEHLHPRNTKNPLFDRAEFCFEGIYIHEYNRTRNPSSGANAANIYQCMLMGSDALVLGNGTRERLVRRKEDAYGDKYGVGIKCVFGVARADFVSADNNTTLNQSSAQWNVWANSTI